MIKGDKPSRPTDGELKILRVLWRYGPRTVRQVAEHLQGKPPTSYTAVLRQLQVMFEKGHVLRDESQRSHIYRAARTQKETERNVVRKLIDATFAGMGRELVTHVLEIKKIPQKEIDRIRKLFDEAEEPEK